MFIFIKKPQYFIKVGCFYLFLLYIRSFNFFKIESYPCNDPCKTHSPARSPKKIGMFCWRTGNFFTAGQYDVHIQYMSGKRTINMVVLSMNVACNCSTYCNKFGSRSNWKEPAFGNNY